MYIPSQPSGARRGLSPTKAGRVLAMLARQGYLLANVREPGHARAYRLPALG